jgi:hypothetical protein
MAHYGSDTELETEFTTDDEEFYSFYLSGGPIVKQLIAEVLGAEQAPALGKEEARGYSA